MSYALIDTKSMVLEEREFRTAPSISSIELESLKLVFEATIGNYLILISKVEQYVDTLLIDKNIMSDFLEKAFTISCPRILKFTIAKQQLYLLHAFSSLLVKFNDTELQSDNFYEKIYLPNILCLCSKKFTDTRRFISRQIQKTYDELYKKLLSTGDLFDEFQSMDQIRIKHDLTYLFLKDVIPKFDPISIVDIEEFYIVLLQRILFFYLKSRVSNQNDLEEPEQKRESMYSGVVVSERYKIYEEALYLAQVQNVCNSSSAVQRISDNYDKIKSLILPHELQKLYILSKSNGNSKKFLSNQKMIFIRTQFELSNTDVINKEFPQISKLLRSVHIKSDTPSISNIQYLNETIYNTLYSRFKNILDESVLVPVIRKITDNLVSSITVGEFIDVITMNKVNIYEIKFVKELVAFLNIIIDKFSDVQEYGIDD